MGHELVAWYPLDGNLNDYSPYKGKNTINSNSITYTVNYAASGKSYAKCATSGYAKITIAELVNKVTFSYSFWIYTNTDPTGDWRSALRINDGKDNMRFETCKTDGYPRYGVYNNSANAAFTNGFPNYYGSISSVYGKWHHIVITRDEHYVKGYFDGVVSSGVGTSTGAALPGSFEILPGNDSRSNISDIRVYNYVLSQKEINDLYKAPVALYNFEAFNLAGSDTLNLYSGSSADGAGEASSFTRTAKDGYYNYSASLTTAPTSNGWPNIRFPQYSFSAGSTYTVSLEIRVNKWECSSSNFGLTLRHSRRDNDYETPKRITIADSRLADGQWRRYSLTLQLNSTHANGSSTTATNPRIELYTGSYKDLTYNLNFDLRNVMVTKTSNLVSYNNGSNTISFIPDNSGHQNNMSFSNIKLVENSSYEHGGKTIGYFNKAYMSCPSILGKLMMSEGFTYALDFEINSMTTAGLLIDRINIGYTFAIFIVNSGMRIDTSSGQHTINGLSFTTGVLYHLMFVNDGSKNYLYINGALKDSWNGKIDVHGNTTSIGASQTNGSGYGNYLNGYITNAEIYATPFTAAMVSEYYKTKIRVSNNYDFHGYNIVEDYGNKNPVSMDYMMNGNFNRITEDPSSLAMKFYDDASMKTHGLYANSATLESTTVSGNLEALGLTLNDCCSKGIYNSNVSVINYSYDNHIYFEPDGSTWVRIFHHNNPAGGLFSNSDPFSSGKVYKDANKWFACGACSLVSSWELMIKQKLQSNSSEVKYRWTQPTNPRTCSYSDIHGKVVHNTTSGYRNYAYGGLFRKNSSAYLVTDNNTNGSNWFGAVGSWSAYGGGIPSYPDSAVTSGYMDLYIRVNIPGDANNIFTSADVVRYIDSYVSGALTK